MVERGIRYAVAALGVLAAAYGLCGLWKIRAGIHKVNFAEWLLGGVLLHDLIIATVVFLVGLVLSRTLPPHLRGYVQGGLIVIGLTGGFAFFLIWRQGTSHSPALALLQQNYQLNYAIIVAVVVVCTAGLYAISLRTIRKSRSD